MAESTVPEPDVKSDKNAKETPATPVGQAPGAAAAGKRRKLILIGVLGGAVLIGGAAGSQLLAPKIVASRASKGSVAVSEKKEGGHGSGKHGESAGSSGAVFKIDNLIVNPAETQGTRFLMATVAFEVTDPKLEEVMRERDVEIRDKVISVLESQTMEMLTQPGARDSLKILLGDAIAPIAGGSHLRVFLPQFVIQ